MYEFPNHEFFCYLWFNQCFSFWVRQNIPGKTTPCSSQWSIFPLSMICVGKKSPFSVTENVSFNQPLYWYTSANLYNPTFCKLNAPMFNPSSSISVGGDHEPLMEYMQPHVCQVVILHPVQCSMHSKTWNRQIPSQNVFWHSCKPCLRCIFQFLFTFRQYNEYIAFVYHAVFSVLAQKSRGWSNQQH